MLMINDYSACDIMMQMCANAKERSHDDWSALLAAVDERFEILSITTPKHSALSIIEVIWRGDDPNDNDDLPELASPHDSDSDVTMGRDSFSVFERDSSSEAECSHSRKKQKMMTTTFETIGFDMPYARDARTAREQSYVPVNYESDQEEVTEQSCTSRFYTQADRETQEG